jgi:hypothetical protein
MYFQAVLRVTPLSSDVYLFAFVISSSLVGMGTGIYIKKSGHYRLPIWLGFILMTIGFGLFVNLTAKPNWTKIILFQIIAGIGIGPNFQSPLIALQSCVDQGDVAGATAAFGFVRNLSMSISIVIGGVMFQNQVAKKYPALAADLGSQIAASLSGGSAGANVGLLEHCFLVPKLLLAKLSSIPYVLYGLCTLPFLHWGWLAAFLSRNRI